MRCGARGAATAPGRSGGGRPPQRRPGAGREGVGMVEVPEGDGVDRLVAVHEAVFGHGQPRFRAQLLYQLERDPAPNILVLAMAGEQAVSAARAEFPKTGS